MQRPAPAIKALDARMRVRVLGLFLTLVTALVLHAGPARAQATIPSNAAYACDFENTWCDFNEQSKLEPTGGRSSIVTTAASGARGIKLTTLVGDNNVHGSGTWERTDLSKGPDASYCNAGQEEWWAFSIMFPSDYVFPPGPEAGIVMDFHHNASSGQANYEIQTIPGIGLRARGYGGSAINSGKYDALIPDPYGAATGSVTRNQWYHFVLHVRWSPNGDGLMEGWVNGRKYQSYQGPTLYAGISCYFKLANYHAPFGQASSVVFDRVVRGGSAGAVSALTLEGVGNAPIGSSNPPAGTYALSTVTMGSGSGAVTSSPSAINCGSTCSSTFAGGSTVTLNATPASGSAFAGWSGACSGTASCTVSMTSAKSVTATFNAATTSTASSLVPHFYRTILRREPDSAGAAFWNSESTRMTSLGVSATEVWYAMTSAFFASAEYAALNRDDAGFVRDLYNSYLDRSSDAAGLAYWTGLLAQGMPRDVLVTQFMFSTEFTTKAGGVGSSRVEVDTVVDFYRGLLARLPDSGGFAFWLGQFRSAQCRGVDAVNAQADAISASFANGAEAAARRRSNGQYVADLYNAFLRRGGDLSGVRFWIQELERGRPRDDVRRGFLASPEFSARVRAIVAAGCAG